MRCGEELFEVDKSVVTCGSEYFRAMLEHEMAESASGAVELEQVSPRVFGRVVRWLYTGEFGGDLGCRGGAGAAAGGDAPGASGAQPFGDS